MSGLTEALDVLVEDLSEYGMSPELRQTVGAARRWDAFPSDEDVEVAINVFRSTPRSPNDGWDGWLNPMRAALEAVKTRRSA